MRDTAAKEDLFGGEVCNDHRYDFGDVQWMLPRGVQGLNVVLLESVIAHREQGGGEEERRGTVS